jgi:hypothetical protein
MKRDTKNQKLLKLTKETIKKLDQNGLRVVVGGDSRVIVPRPQKVHEA